jgi:hypothetical protein
VLIGSVLKGVLSNAAKRHENQLQTNLTAAVRLFLIMIVLSKASKILHLYIFSNITNGFSKSLY